LLWSLSFAGLAGVLAGRILVEAPRASETELHASASQTAQAFCGAEGRKSTASRRNMPRAAMRSNWTCAPPMSRSRRRSRREHGYGPRVTVAIDETHRVMGELQKETLQHLFAMRAVLDREQTALFDKSVVKALTANAR
jgi:hypothetical protein